MKNIPFLILLIVATCCAACKKEDSEVIPTVGVIQVIHTVTGIPNIKFQAGGASDWELMPNQAYGSGRLYYAATGSNQLLAVDAAEVGKRLFNSPVNLKNTIYTLYISGTAASPDTLFKEEIAYPNIVINTNTIHNLDSVVNVRFVNLSANSPALRINLKNSEGPMSDNLGYQSIGNWSAYPAVLAATAYEFDIRNANTDEWITTYTFSATATNRFKNVALVIRGEFGTAGFGVSAVNYF